MNGAAFQAQSASVATAAATAAAGADPNVQSNGRGQTKVTLCHVPPGNPANAHTITIGAPAAIAHLRNHPDYLGSCVSGTSSRSTTAIPPGRASGTAAINKVQRAVQQRDRDRDRDPDRDAAAEKARGIQGQLPFTGFNVATAALCGLALMGSGIVLRRRQARGRNLIGF